MFVYFLFETWIIQQFTNSAFQPIFQFTLRPVCYCIWINMLNVFFNDYKRTNNQNSYPSTHKLVLLHTMLCECCFVCCIKVAAQLCFVDSLNLPAVGEKTVILRWKYFLSCFNLLIPYQFSASSSIVLIKKHLKETWI